MKRIAILILILCLCACGGPAEIRGLRKGIGATATALASADNALTAAVSIIEPTIAEQVREACKEADACMEVYRKQLEPYTYAADTLDTAGTALRALEASVDVYEHAGDQASLMIVVEDLNTLAFVLTDLIAQLRGLGVEVPRELESALSRLEAITAGVPHGNR